MTDLDALLAELAADRKPGPASEAHARIIEQIKRAMSESPIRYPDRYEFKVEEVTHKGRTTTLLIEAGLIGDEGTYASIFARNRRHITIGPRGGLTLLNPKRRKGAKAWSPAYGRFAAIHALTR